MFRHAFEGESEEESVIEPVSLGGARAGFDGRKLFIHGGGLDDPEALLTPAGHGHFLDEEGLAGVGGMVRSDDGRVEGGEAFLVFVAETDAGGEAGGGREAVGDGVGG